MTVNKLPSCVYLNILQMAINRHKMEKNEDVDISGIIRLHLEKILDAELAAGGLSEKLHEVYNNILKETR